jgi:clan AA aspartic protease
MDVLAWIDTAFNGELVLPRAIIDSANLAQTAGIEATLADGTVVVLETFSCAVEWFGATRMVEVIANTGVFPLVGIGLLIGRRLTVDYAHLTVSIE